VGCLGLIVELTPLMETVFAEVDRGCEIAKSKVAVKQNAADPT
jgi:hypothetical protein